MKKTTLSNIKRATVAKNSTFTIGIKLEFPKKIRIDPFVSKWDSRKHYMFQSWFILKKLKAMSFF